MYYLPQPPLLLPAIGVFIAITCGAAFQNLLSQKLADSYRNVQAKSSFKLDQSHDGAATFVFWGVCTGVWLFLGGGLFVLGFGFLPAYTVGLILAYLTGALVWSQINDVLNQLKMGGSEALKLK